MRRVVVGVDGSEGARAALQWAVAEADQWGVPLVAVWAWEFSPLIVATDAPVKLQELGAAVEEQLREVLEEELGETRAAAVEMRPVEDAPVRALIDAAEPGDLLVVGSRGYGGIKGALLGSVSRQVVQHAGCPVTVVRPAPEEM
jgi:nucleotide-binding universal stress UspA family protein